MKHMVFVQIAINVMIICALWLGNGGSIQAEKPYKRACITGSVTVYVFLADACPICQTYAPTLKALSEKYAASAVFVGIFPDPFTTDSDVRTFADAYPCGFPLWRDSLQTLTRQLQARITPEVVVVSARGTTLYRGRIDNQFPGLGKRRTIVTEHDLDDALGAIAKGHRVKTAQTQAVGCWVERIEATARK
jgi:thiol-disulfide isomerase/thioredoxin